MSDALQRRGRELRAMIDSGALDEREMEAELRLVDDPADAGALAELAEARRARGQLDEAAEAYQRLAELRPGDEHARRLAALLSGEPPAKVRAIPTSFDLCDDFLPGDVLAATLGLIRERRARFEPTAVKTAEGDVYDQTSRKSSHCTDLDPLGPLLTAALLDRLPTTLARVELDPFAAEVRSMKFNAFHDGGFFCLHQDVTGGVALSRKLAFLLYLSFPPKRFWGGELLIYDRDPATFYPSTSFTTIEPESNRLVIMPANCWHEVLPVRTDSDDWEAARFTVSGWIHDKRFKDHPAGSGG